MSRLASVLYQPALTSTLQTPGHDGDKSVNVIAAWYYKAFAGLIWNNDEKAGSDRLPACHFPCVGPDHDATALPMTGAGILRIGGA